MNRLEHDPRKKDLYHSEAVLPNPPAGQQAGFQTGTSWADHLIRDGYSPIAVQEITSMPANYIRQLFAAHPDRAEQWQGELQPKSRQS